MDGTPRDLLESAARAGHTLEEKAASARACRGARPGHPTPRKEAVTAGEEKQLKTYTLPGMVRMILKQGTVPEALPRQLLPVLEVIRSINVRWLESLV